jgi:hypothetical protein
MDDQDLSTPQKKALLVWTTMSEFYGQAWVERYSALPSPAWVELCSHLSPRLIRRGIKGILNGYSKGIPSLPTFKQACFATQPGETIKPAPQEEPVRSAAECALNLLYFKVCTLCAPLSDRAVELLLKQKHMAMPGVQAAIDEKDYEGADYMIRKLEKNWVSIAMDNLR